jgi:hypothetical protein
MVQKMRECCKNFFDIEGLQGEENIPMQFCPYCGRKLTDKEFAYYNKRLGTNKNIKGFALVDYKGNIEPYNGAMAIYELKEDAEFNKYFYETTKPKVTACIITLVRK